MSEQEKKTSVKPDPKPGPEIKKGESTNTNTKTKTGSRVVIHSKRSEEPLEPVAYSFPFPKLDDFQHNGFLCINRSENLFAAVHTSGGKTSLATYAIAHQLRKFKELGDDGVIVYLSPIKTLSEQIVRDLHADLDGWAVENDIPLTIGLILGDSQENPDGNVVVMTTEILRSALYQIGEDNVSRKASRLSDGFISRIRCAIFDEVHYITDKDRGVVWEESLIFLNPKVQLIMLSATIGNPEQFCDWISRKNDGAIVNLVRTTSRVIPLEHYLFWDNKLHTFVTPDNRFNHKTYQEIYNQYQRLGKQRHAERRGRQNLPLLNQSIRYLRDHDMLPANYFCFSRALCQQLASQVPYTLLESKQVAQVRKVWEKLMLPYKERYQTKPQYVEVYNLVQKGVCYHHRGVLKILKQAIEILFSQGLIKVLFATETLAVGVNMPTRASVFVSLTKRDRHGRRSLTTAEYLQMAGRAGRRGKDTKGHAIVVPLFSELAQIRDAVQMTVGDPPKMVSRLDLDHKRILKLCLTPDETLDDFLSRSFYNQETTAQVAHLKKEIMRMEEELKSAEAADSWEADSALKDRLVRYHRLKNPPSMNGMVVRIKQSKSDKKFLRQFPESDEFAVYEQYCGRLDQVGQLERAKDQLYGLTGHFYSKAECYMEFYYRLGYINSPKLSLMTPDNATLRGLLASQIDRCNDVLFTELVLSTQLDELESEEIAAVVSALGSETRIGDDNYPGLVQCTDSVYYTLEWLHEQAEYGQEVEHEVGIPSIHDRYWALDYRFVDTTYVWAMGGTVEDAQDCCVEPMFAGDFVRSMLRVRDMVHDLIELCKIAKKVTLIPKLTPIENMLIRGIVGDDSLYTKSS